MKTMLSNFIYIFRSFRLISILNVAGLAVAFAQRTPIYWWMFVLALLVVSAITIATVTIQNWKTATMNPVKSIVNN